MRCCQLLLNKTCFRFASELVCISHTRFAAFCYERWTLARLEQAVEASVGTAGRQVVQYTALWAMLSVRPAAVQIIHGLEI